MLAHTQQKVSQPITLAHAQQEHPNFMGRVVCQILVLSS